MNLKIQYVHPDKLKPFPGNPRKNDKAAEKLITLIAEHGFVNPIVATPDGLIRAGHTRWKAAQKMQLKEVPVIYKQFESEAHAQAYAIADNRASDWAEWDFPKLKDMVSEIDTGAFPINLTGFEQSELDDIFGNDQAQLIECPNCQCKFNKSRKIMTEAMA